MGGGVKALVSVQYCVDVWTAFDIRYTDFDNVDPEKYM